MTYRTRINYSPQQKAEMWDRWQLGAANVAWTTIWINRQETVFDSCGIKSHRKL